MTHEFQNFNNFIMLCIRKDINKSIFSKSKYIIHKSFIDIPTRLKERSRLTENGKKNYIINVSCTIPLPYYTFNMHFEVDKIEIKYLLKNNICEILETYTMLNTYEMVLTPRAILTML